MERSPSETSIGFPETCPSAPVLVSKEAPDQRLFGDTDSESRLLPGDAFCVAVTCKEHKRIALQRQDDNSYFLPYVEKSFDNVSFETVLRTLLRALLRKITLPGLSKLVCQLIVPPFKTIPFFQARLYSLN